MPKYIQQLETWIMALAPHVSEPVHFKFHRPFDGKQCRDAAARLGREIPRQISEFLCTEASEIQFWWDLNDRAIPLDVPNKPYGGYFEFDIESLSNINHAGELGSSHPGVSSAARERWKHAFRFVGVPNGDAIGLDLVDDRDNPPVVYLNHEEPEKEVRLADSFEAFMDAWFSLGCVGPECWNLCHFVTDSGEPLAEYSDGTPTSRLDPGCENAKVFKGFFGL